MGEPNNLRDRMEADLDSLCAMYAKCWVASSVKVDLALRIADRHQEIRALIAASRQEAR